MAQHHNPHAEDEPAPDVTTLSQSRQDLLAVVGEVFQEFHPEPGVLMDLPQVVIDSGSIAQACRLAKDDPRLDFKLLLCLACVDYQESFQVVYLLHSLTHEQILAVKTNLPYDNPSLPSVTPVWRAADWYEREAHDLFGVEFLGHPDLSPLLLYEGFEGFPGRKEFPFNDYQEF